LGGWIPMVGVFLMLVVLVWVVVGLGVTVDGFLWPIEKYDLLSFHMGFRSWVLILDALAAK
jgi:hypothetical protein